MSLVITPKPGTAAAPQNICVEGSATRYPSVEGYYGNNGVASPVSDAAERLFNSGAILPPNVASRMLMTRPSGIVDLELCPRVGLAYPLVAR